MKLRSMTLDELTIEDERSFRHIALYGELKAVLRRDGYRFRVPVEGASWDRVLFLNLTFWDPDEPGDLLATGRIAADVVAHVAWHHLAGKALDLHAGPSSPAAEGLLLAESIASAFDLYLVGRTLGHAPDSEFLETQVPAMADAAEAAGLPPERFEALLREIAAEPERAFEDLRSLLFDVGASLVRCESLARAAEVLEGFAAHRFAPLLHHYELSTWILHARSYSRAHGLDPVARAVDASLRAAAVSLDWLEERWVRGDTSAS